MCRPGRPAPGRGRAPASGLRACGHNLGTAVRTSFQALFNPRRIAAVIQDGVDARHLPGNLVVHGEGEPFGQEAVLAEVPLVNVRVELEGINVRLQGVEEVVAQPCRLSFVEAEAVEHVPFRFVKNFDLHWACSLIRRFASAQSA